MRAKDLRPGAVYAVKVSGAVCPLRLEHGYADDGKPAGAGPWTCRNLKTGRRVMVRGAARFRYELEPTSPEELERTGIEYRKKEPEVAGPLTCAACGLELERDRCVRSNHTGASYCWPGEGCQAPTPAALALIEGTEEIHGWSVGAPELGPELEPLELEESGQTRIGVAGEQRAFPGLAPAGKPAPLTFERDELERDAREELVGLVTEADHGRDVTIAGVRFQIEAPFRRPTQEA